MFEPFAGSLAVLLNRPTPPRLETVNDLDCHIVNLWRAIQQDPEGLARLVDEPSNEITLHAYHWWLVEPQRRAAFENALIADPEYYDLTRAARWLHGICCWIGGGWCSGEGPWQVVDGELVRSANGEGRLHRQLPHLGNAGRGITRQRPHLGNAGQGITRQLPHLGGARGTGEQGIQRVQDEGLYAWMQALCARLRRVRVTCGDWTRVLGPSVTWKHGLTGVVLDPPYSHSERDSSLYAVEADIAPAIQAWCLTHGDNPLLRIVLCGYEGEYALPGWRVIPWKANGGMSNQNVDKDNQNKYRERLWLSPACLDQRQPDLFGRSPC